MQTALRLTAILAAVTAPGFALAQAQGQAPQAQASALPPPPYAAAEQRSTTLQRPAYYGGEQSYDRYGGGGSHPQVQAYPSINSAARNAADAAAGPAYNGPRLAWSGKTDAAPAPQRPAPYAQRYQAANTSVAQPTQSAPEAPYTPPPPYQPRRAPPRTYASAPTARMAAAYAAPSAPVAVESSDAAPAGWSFIAPIGARGQEPAAPASAALPTSIYAPPPPAPDAPAAPATQAVAANTSTDGARHYSVHRDYGMAPDPIPLPPQFFGNTADMSAPATDAPIQRTVTADGKSHNPLQPADGQ